VQTAKSKIIIRASLIQLKRTYTFKNTHQSTN